MKNARNQDKKLSLLATLLLLLAIPISLLGVNQVNDIRNRAQEEEPPVSFLSDFTSNDFTTAYTSMSYSQHVDLTGDYAPVAMLTLGCDSSVCGDTCTTAAHNPPDGFGFADDRETLFWKHPGIQDDQSSWPITVTAMVPNEEPDAKFDYTCFSENFELSVSTSTPDKPPTCSIHTTKSLRAIPQGSSASLILEGSDPGSGLSSAMIRLTPDEGAPYVYEWDFPDSPETILLNNDSSPELEDLPDNVGTYDIYASVTDVDGITAECVNDVESKLSIVIPGDNGSPEFETDPYTDSRPSTDIEVGTSYTYTVEASDPNGDSMNYYVINNTGWLTFTENNSPDGSFTGTFSGTPTAPGSYTAVIALNDGFHDHYSTQIWVINVSSDENDTPVVTVEEPEEGSILEQGGTTTVRWSATDSNLITRFDVYVTKDPTQKGAWSPLISNLAYNYDSYVWDIGNIEKGTYYIVVEATDNQNPAGVGIGTSGAFGIGIAPSTDGAEEPEGPDIVDSYPVISNILPENQSETDDTTPLISADLAASEGETIDTASVKVILDDENITGLAILNRGGEAEGSLMYTPAQPLAVGSHKVSVSFKDSAEKNAAKEWTFTIVATETDETDEDTGDTVTILGITLPKRTAYIIGIGLALFILALLIPWLLFAAWRRSRNEEDSLDGRPFGGTLPPDPGFGNLSSIAAQPSPPSAGPVAPPKPSPKPPITFPTQEPETEPAPESKHPQSTLHEPLPETEPLPEPEPKEPELSEPSSQPPLTPQPDTSPEVESSEDEHALTPDQKNPPTQPETTPPGEDSGEPTEEELVAALQQIAEEETQKLPEELQPKEPAPKAQPSLKEPGPAEGKDPGETAEKSGAGKPPLKPSDLSNLLKNGPPPEDPDADDYTIA